MPHEQDGRGVGLDLARPEHVEVYSLWNDTSDPWEGCVGIARDSDSSGGTRNAQHLEGVLRELHQACRGLARVTSLRQRRAADSAYDGCPRMEEVVVAEGMDDVER